MESFQVCIYFVLDKKIDKFNLNTPCSYYTYSTKSFEKWPLIISFENSVISASSLTNSIHFTPRDIYWVKNIHVGVARFKLNNANFKFYGTVELYALLV